MKPDHQCVWVNDDLSDGHSQGAGDDAQGAAGGVIAFGGRALGAHALVTMDREAARLQ